MPEYNAPGVFVEEVPFRSRSISGVSTSTAAFVGPTHLSWERIDEPVTSVCDFECRYGDASDLVIAGTATPNYLAHAAKAFFDNGGRRLYVLRVEPDALAADYAAALVVSYPIADISVVGAPGYSARSDAAQIQAALVDHVEQAPAHDRYRFAVLDSPPAASPEEVANSRAGIDSSRAAIYYPWVSADDAPWLPPSGFICGLLARVDAQRGVWKAPANEELVGVRALQTRLTDAQQDLLNLEGINCIRDFPGRGILLWGARTTSGQSEWKYVNVRRYALYLEQSIAHGLQWVIFEPNDESLWAEVRRSVSDFLVADWRNGALRGNKPEEAFFVRCDRATMTQSDIDDGRMIVEIGMAPVRPAEFVIIRIGLWTASHADPP